MSETHYNLDERDSATVLRIISPDSTNRLTRACVLALTGAVRDLARDPRPLVITGNHKFFSAGADLEEIVALTGPAAYEFSHMGQALMNEIECFPAPIIAAVSGYCMGGGLDLALACHRRIASPHAVFGHRGAALGLITGWGGTQRLPRLVGKTRALQMMIEAEKIHAREALRIGLVNAIEDDPVSAAIEQLGAKS
ncbi:MAG TPA: enoyl-CoA hydratase/isomerase family protein [Terriglobales bacterium]|jgi:enoyl-CoA hydratase/carnithine racemase|nr:enoyl-CoA hydratase/isomerase family protein [Terriglobales bacterium]